MLLGGIRYLLPVIETAHKYGYHVITVDYIPDNIAHKYSDEYHNVSILDKEAVLKLARDLQINGILSFAVDPGVVTAAYVAGQMNLPFSCSYSAACTLQNKVLFRQFLTENGFNVPTARGYSSVESAVVDAGVFHWPVIVKPADSAGSKGVTRVDCPEDLCWAVQEALAASHSNSFIVEDYLEKEGLSSGSESFFVDGKLMYNGFYDQFFDKNAANPYTPSAECWPADKPESVLNVVRSELQRLSDLLHFGTGLFNVEWRVCTDGKVYLMEVSPRAGGNRLAEILNNAADVDLIDAEVRKAMGETVSGIHEPDYRGCYAIQVLHASSSGRFEGIDINPDFEKSYVIETEIRVKKGDLISSFTGANSALGTLFLRTETRREMDRLLGNISDFVNVNVEREMKVKVSAGLSQKKES